MMANSGFNEKVTTQQGVIDLLVAAGWRYVAGADLPRTTKNVLIESDAKAAIARLNPHLDGREDAVLTKLRTAITAEPDIGLMAANEEFTKLLRGRGTVLDTATNHDRSFRLIDFENPDNNVFLVTDEVTYQGARFDIVLWVNGIPIAVGEMKAPSSNWAKGAKDIYTSYEVEQAGFFVPNLLSFATETKDFRYAGVRTPLDHWQKWGAMDVDPKVDGFERMKMTVSGLLAPRVVLNLIEHYAMHETTADDAGVARTIKILPRYFQYDAVEKIVKRATSKPQSRGLIYHTQGSGKTLTMSWVATRLVMDQRMKSPTVIAIADRTQLVKQTFAQFQASGLPDPAEASSIAALQTSLKNDVRGIIATTVHKFAGAGVLSERENIILLVDEAHRTQEGSLGEALRKALPNAHRYGFTGTPISDGDRNTYRLFGDPDDKGWSLSTYDSDRSTADGTTVDIVVVPRPVEFDLAKDQLDDAFDALAEQEGLDEATKEKIASKNATARAVFHNPKRIRVVVENIVSHFYSTIDPIGMKAQIFVADQELCIEYDKVLKDVLAERGYVDESAVVISGTGSKLDLSAYQLTDAQEEDLLDRFRAFEDPLKFLIVTAKLGTGFNAPIEGVLYLDKPMKMHTLFQTITRTNRPWSSPEGDFTKERGTIVDYVGLGDGFARAMRPSDPERAKREIEVDALIVAVQNALKEIRRRFVGVPRDASADSLQQARERIPTGSEDQDEFRAEFLFAQGLWETVWPNEDLDPLEDDYAWYASVYKALPIPTDDTDLIVDRLGPKTRKLVHQHMTDVHVKDPGKIVTVADADTIKKLVNDGRLPEPPEDQTGKSAEEIIENLTARIKRKLEGPDAAKYTPIAERIDRIREMFITNAEESIRALEALFGAAADLTKLEKGADPDDKVGNLTRIFRENTPGGQTEVIEQIVTEIDTLVRQAVFAGWESREASQKAVKKKLRGVLRKHRIPTTGEPFDSAWEYIVAHYRGDE